jgi:hypothetical protein
MIWQGPGTNTVLPYRWRGLLSWHNMRWNGSRTEDEQELWGTRKFCA